MKRARTWSSTATLLLALTYSAGATAFSLSFQWGDIPYCSDGQPNRVSNPIFALGEVPDGTKTIEFEIVDRNAPGYYHGGGTIRYAGQRTIEPGAFEYESPCPPRGTHTYEWTAQAKDGAGNTLATTKASKRYPE